MAPGWSGTQRLVRRFGASVGAAHGARRQAVHRRGGAGRSASSTRSSRPAKALARAEAIAADIAKRGPVAVQIVKAMINAAEGEDRDAPIEGLAGALDRDDAGPRRGRRGVPRQAARQLLGAMKGDDAMNAQTPILLDSDRLAEALARFPARPRDVDRRARGCRRSGETIARLQPGAWRARHPRSARRRERRRSGRSPPRARRSTQGPWPHATASERSRLLLKTADLIDRDRETSGAARYARIRQADRPGALRDRGRRRHLALRGGACPRSARRELRVARGRPPRLRAARADRRRLDHHALEFPAADRLAEAALRARRRLHMRRQAERDDLGFDAASRRASSPRPACRKASATSSPATGRRSARR